MMAVNLPSGLEKEDHFMPIFPKTWIEDWAQKNVLLSTKIICENAKPFLLKQFAKIYRNKI